MSNNSFEWDDLITKKVCLHPTGSNKNLKKKTKNFLALVNTELFDILIILSRHYYKYYHVIS